MNLKEVTEQERQTLMPPEYALIVAGGKGTRFGSRIPKQFLELNGRPVLLHTLDAFVRYSAKIRLVVALPKEDIAAWGEICDKHQYITPVEIVAGGATRFQSVKNGLEKIPDSALVAIHDGVRPLVSTKLIASSFALAKIHGAAVASVPLKESLRLIEEDENSALKSSAVDRSRYRIIQTPQTFNARLIRSAYLISEDEALTDDASVAERAGLSIFLFDGDPINIKITNREDLLIAQTLMGRAFGL